MSQSFTDKVVIITGSSSGIGEATAHHFSSLGAHVVVTGRNKDRVQKVATQCAEYSPKNYWPLEVVCDLINPTDCHRLIDAALLKYGKIDVLVNNAGIAKMCFVEAPSIMDTFRSVWSTNVEPVVLLSHLALPHLVKTKGSIVNISSCSGLRPYIGGSAYCSSKAALDMITRCMALEYGPKGVRVNSVNPAVTRTPIFEVANKSAENTNMLYKAVENTYPSGRVIEPEEIAKAIGFLASSDASSITGLLLWVDGGSLDSPGTHAPKELVDLLRR